MGLTKTNQDLRRDLKSAALALEDAAQDMFRMAKQYGEAELLAAMQRIEALYVEADRLTQYADEVKAGKILRTPSEKCPADTCRDTPLSQRAGIDCVACPMKAKYCLNTAFRKIARSVHEAARNVARCIAATAQYVRSRHERKKVEMLFAHLKRILKMDRLRLRGMSGATDEFTLAAAVQNLRRLAKLTSQGSPLTG